MTNSSRAETEGPLNGEVVEFLQRSIAGSEDARFEELALGEFALLYRTNAAYRAFCDGIGRSPASVRSWEEIPPVASFALRKVRAGASTPVNAEELARRIGMVDLWRIGKTLHPLSRGRHARELGSAVASALAQRYVFPDVDRMELLLLVPPPLMAPGMVMASGLARMLPKFGTPGSRFLISFMGLELKALLRALARAESSQRPVAIIGATFVIDRLLGACREQGVRFELPPGSRVVDSGGFEARYIGCTKEEYFEKCRTTLGVAEPYCVNALWLCESSTIYFDGTLRSAQAGMSADRAKEVPQWARVLVVDPYDFQPVAKGSIGLLRLYDLTNRAMAVALQTDKLGYETANGFEVVGNWCKVLGSVEIDRAPLHPGGRLATAAMTFLLRSQLSGLRLYLK